MIYLIIALSSLVIFVLINIILNLIMGVQVRKIRRSTIAFVVSILVVLTVRVIYDITSAIKSIDIEFYVALIGGAAAITIYNTICNGKKVKEVREKM